jgi:hypothetical protein
MPQNCQKLFPFLCLIYGFTKAKGKTNHNYMKSLTTNKSFCFFQTFITMGLFGISSRLIICQPLRFQCMTNLDFTGGFALAVSINF